MIVILVVFVVLLVGWVWIDVRRSLRGAAEARERLRGRFL